MSTAVSAPENKLVSTRYTLLSRLQDWDDHESWKDFFDTYWRLIYSVALKSGLTEAEAQDAVQETVIAVAKSIHKFKRDRKRGSFRGWLRNITRWRIADQLRKRTAAQTLDEAGLQEIPDEADNALATVWDAEWESNIFEAAVERVKKRVKLEHYQMFHLHVIKQKPAAEVAKGLRVGVGQVYLARHRVSALIKKEIRALQQNFF